MQATGEIVFLNRAGKSSSAAAIAPTTDPNRPRRVSFMFNEQTVAARIAALQKYYPLITVVISLKYTLVVGGQLIDTGLALDTVTTKEEVMDLIESLVTVANEDYNKKLASRQLDALPVSERPEGIVSTLDLRTDVVGRITSLADQATDVDDFLDVGAALDEILRATVPITVPSIEGTVEETVKVPILPITLEVNEQSAVGAPLPPAPPESLSPMSLGEIIIEVDTLPGGDTMIKIKERNNGLITITDRPGDVIDIRDAFEREAAFACTSILAAGEKPLVITMSLVMMNKHTRDTCAKMIRELFLGRLMRQGGGYLHVKSVFQSVHSIRTKHMLDTAEPMYVNTAYTKSELFGESPEAVSSARSAVMKETPNVVTIEID